VQWSYRDDGLVEVTGGQVRPEWLDYNGHMNVAYYVLAFDLVIDLQFDAIGLTLELRDPEGHSCFAAESHVMWHRELHLGDPLRFEWQLLAYDGKRMHSFHRLYHAEKGWLAASAEWLQLSIDMKRRRVAPWPEPVLQRIAAIWDRQRDLPRPADAGRRVMEPRQSSSR